MMRNFILVLLLALAGFIGTIDGVVAQENSAIEGVSGGGSGEADVEIGIIENAIAESVPQVGGPIENIGAAHEWQLGLMEPQTPVAHGVHDFHNFLLYIVYGISALVLSLILWICIRYWHVFNKKAATFHHNVKLEIAWIMIPIVVVVVIIWKSIDLLDLMEIPQDAEMTVTVTGHQWYWEYEYDDFGDIENGNVSYTSNLRRDENGEPTGPLRLLNVNEGERLILPVDTTIRFIVTSDPDDVIHSFAVPSFAIKIDAVPGKINETWARIEEVGLYYGQCSELCGEGHAYMPIAIEAVTRDEFNAWIATEQTANGMAAENIQQLADASPDVSVSSSDEVSSLEEELIAE